MSKFSDALTTVTGSNSEVIYDTGLILCGGAARGFIHVGVIEALEEKSLVPDIVSGVSSGYIIRSF
jgi:predicted acylesterase/phospholipase RssA